MANGLTFGGIAAVDNSTAETTTDATPRKIAAFDTVGEENRCTGSASTDDITVAEAGTYIVLGHLSFVGTANKTFKVQAQKNTTLVGIPMERKIGASSDVGSASFTAAIALAASDTVSVCQWSTDGGTAATFQQISLSIFRVL